MEFLVTHFVANSGNIYVIIYNSDTGITTTKTGSAPDDLTVTEEELRYSNGELRYQNCVGDDRHTVYMSTTYPFATFTIEPNHASCVVVPPTPPTPPVVPPPVLTENYICYQVKFKNFEEQIVEANIFDQTTYEIGREIEYRPLKPAGDPVVIECIDNDEDKFTPVRAKQCIITFNSSNQLNLNLFSEGQDNRWYVEVKVSDAIKFKGFLVLNDLNEAFLSPPNVVTLTAIDGLGTLKDIPLTNFDGVSPIVVRPKTHYRWIDYLGWALSKTSQSLFINIEHNLREEHSENEPFWEEIYLDPKTFEDEIGTCVNCYQVLEILLGKDCFITQYRGEWWVLRIDEIDSRNRYIWTVQPDLTSSFLNGEPFYRNKTIKKTENIKWINRSALVTLDRPHKYVKPVYNYKFWKEIVDNIDFTRGSQITVIVTPPDESYYFLNDWTIQRFPGAPIAGAYIRRKFVNDIETERSVVITRSAASGGGIHGIVGSRIPMTEKDKFTISFERALELNRSGSSFFRTGVAEIRLYADDGTFYILDGKQTVGGNVVPAIWKTTDATFNLNAGKIWQEGNLSSDDRDWVSISEEVPPLPKGGEIEIILLQTADIPTTSATYFANLRIEYIPYLNGVYQKLEGQYWKVSQEGEYKAVRDEEVFVSDSPKELFKGALMYKDGSDFKLTGGWYDYSLSPTVVPVIPPELKPYGWFQAQSIWNQHRRVMRMIDGELLGLENEDLPDLIHKYSLSDPSPHTNDRFFLCLHFSMSLKKCTWTAYFAEVFKTTEEKVYDDDTIFKYIESR